MTVSLGELSKMAVKKILFWFSVALVAIGANAVGELSILHSPDSLKFSGSSEALESVLKDIYSASLGLSVEEDSDWNGLSITDPFNTPEAVVEVYIDGVANLGKATGLKSKAFPLTVDEYEPDTFKAVSHSIEQRFTNGGNKLVNVKLSDAKELSELFGGISMPKVSKQSLQHLKHSVEEDYRFLQELAVLNSITAKVRSGAVVPDNTIDFYNFRFRSLHALSDFHGPSSLQTKEAKKLLGEALQDLSNAFVKAYDGSVLVTAVTTDIAHTRRAVRAAPEQASRNNVVARGDDTTAETTTPGNSAPSGNTDTKQMMRKPVEDAYSADYSAIFNIILWFSVVFAFSLIAIVYAIMDMDPGRDSIIYRMTSTRMKKDN